MGFYRTVIQLSLACIVTWLGCFTACAQSCPPNIDFETGTFDNWTCYIGNVAAVNNQNVISLTPSNGPVAGRHTMYSSASPSVDPYCGFPVNCPNGSGHSIKLGNDLGGGEAEGISYTFTIPANQNVYSLIYHYAVVFQDPNHLEFQQPRMEIEITNVTDNSLISCSSFAFHPYGTPLPGFKLTPQPVDNTPVWYKEWSAVSINLNGNAGKTIKLFFKTADCTFRRHFGYAYIDVNSECSGTFTGATYCPGDTAVSVIAPYGYQSYTWYDSLLQRVLGSTQTLTLKPPPLSGTTLAVKLEPYNGYGCSQTLYTRLVDTLTVTAHAGPDTFSCNHTPIQIGVPPKPGINYKWSPAAGLSNTDISNPLANPDVTTTYILTASNSGGGCVSTDTVLVGAGGLNNGMVLLGKPTYCLGTADSAVLVVQGGDSVQWYKDNVPIRGATKDTFRVTQTGLYNALLYNRGGCNVTTNSQQVNVSSIPVSSFTTTSNPNQCLATNQFIFKNTSTNAVGTMQYKWLMGDGTVATTRDVSYNYKKAGTYNVKMVVSSNTVCADSTAFAVQVYQNAIADFTVEGACINLPVQPVNNTGDTLSSPVNYLWDFGNGRTSNLRNPPAQTYALPGTYFVSLSVNTPQCPTPLNVLKRPIAIDRPRPATNYPTEYAVINLPLTLHARTFGENVLWTPGTFLDNRTSLTPIFNGTTDQAYAIEIKTTTGCVTVDTQIVKTVKQVEVYVPTAFTPDGDGKNDYLRPILMGVKQVRFFRVFNRWGQLLFETTSDRPGWDGTVKGVKQPTQAVVWMVEALGLDGVNYVKKGTSVLLR
jgi:gliding motility-associated-like protein